MARISETPVRAWKEKIDWFMNSHQCRELDRIDGKPMEVEWQNFPEIQNMMTETECEPEQFPGRIIFMSMYNDIAWRETRKRKFVYCEFQNCGRLCDKIRARTLVVSWAWIRKEMARNPYVQAKWKMGSSR